VEVTIAPLQMLVITREIHHLAIEMVIQMCKLYVIGFFIDEIFYTFFRKKEIS